MSRGIDVASARSGRLSDPDEVHRLTRRGLRLAQFTLAYNVAEGLIAVSAGTSAGVVSLIGFGLDSAIESAIAVLVALRLSARLRKGHSDEAKERRALRAVAITFYLLAAFMIVGGIRALSTDAHPEASPVGIALLIASILIMPALALAKRRVAYRLGGDRLILADAAETLICILLSASTLAGMVLYQLTGAAWLDPVAGFVIAAFAIREGREAWEGELVEHAGSPLP